MCGICGVRFSKWERRAERQLIERMCEQIVHRGPDDQGIHLDGSVGLGMRRLSILDLETGSQPMFNADRSVCIVFNGEIYNFLELRAELARRGHRFSTRCDTEVIVHLYEEYGVDFVEKLNGMFAIAVWDRRHDRLMLVRDRLGQKPLYYAQTDDGLMFGSELKCLLACPSVPRELDHEAVYHYFTLGVIPHPWSIYRHVRQLPPAGRLICERGRVTLDQYWHLPLAVDTALEKAEAVERMRALLADSVRLRMISDVPLGAFLSGGLDSSIVVALMAQQSSTPVKTFHIDFAEPDYSERRYARAVAERYGTEHHELVVRPSAVGLLDELVGAFDEPFGDSSAIPTYCVSKLTREHVTVALAGDGGDESFGGYERYRRILARRHLPGWLRGTLGAVGNVVHSALPRTAPGRRYFRSLGMDHYEHFAVGTDELETRELLSPEFLESVAPGSTYQMLRSGLAAGDPTDALAPFSALDIHHYLPDDILTKVDRVSMAHSLELRAPFLDYRLVELAATMPSHWKIRGAHGKAILKDAFMADLPAEVLEPRKRGFSVPMGQWLRGELRSDLEDALGDRQIEQSGVFQMQEVRALAEEHFSGRRDRSSQLWRYLFFVRWWHGRHTHLTSQPLALSAV